LLKDNLGQRQISSIRDFEIEIVVEYEHHLVSQALDG
jgi:hypothetical protein